jgi:hypothetical protein
MTTEKVATAAPTSEQDPATRPQPADPSLVRQAESIEIGIGPDEDPFDATFLLAGTDLQGRELALWIRLTPTTITDITGQLGEVLFAQQQILGVDGHPGAPAGDDSNEDDDGSEAVEGRVKQFFDPMGIRHLKDRSPRTTVILGAAIGSLVLLAFILQLVRG